MTKQARQETLLVSEGKKKKKRKKVRKRQQLKDLLNVDATLKAEFFLCLKHTSRETATEKVIDLINASGTADEN